MEEDLKRILTAVFGMIVFIFFAFSTIVILTSGKVFDDTVELAEESAKGSVPRALPAGGAQRSPE